MKEKHFDIHRLELECIRQQLNDLDLRLFKLELTNKKPNPFDKPIKGNSDLHHQILYEIARYVNSIEVISNSKYSFNINIEVK